MSHTNHETKRKRRTHPWQVIEETGAMIRTYYCDATTERAACLEARRMLPRLGRGFLLPLSVYRAHLENSQ